MDTLLKRSCCDLLDSIKANIIYSTVIKWSRLHIFTFWIYFMKAPIDRFLKT